MKELLKTSGGLDVQLNMINTAAAATLSRRCGSTLSGDEQIEFTRCEEVIRKGWRAFFEVGRALVRIRDRRLYRAEFQTFAAYCQERWFFGRSHAYRLIATSEALDLLSSDKALQLPTREAHVRPLLRLPSDKIIPVWRSVVQKAASGAVTVELVNAAVNSVRVEDAPPVTRPHARHMSAARRLSKGRVGMPEFVGELLSNAETNLSLLEPLTQSDMMSYMSGINSSGAASPMVRVNAIVRRWESIKRRLYTARASLKTKK